MQAIKLVAILAVASAEVYAEGATRRLVISIPDRKVALIEDGRVVKVYPVAVGKAEHAQPSRQFSYREPGPTSHLVSAGQSGWAWTGQSPRHALDGLGLQRLRDSRNKHAALDRQSCVAWLHPHA